RICHSGVGGQLRIQISIVGASVLKMQNLGSFLEFEAAGNHESAPPDLRKTAAIAGNSPIFQGIELTKTAAYPWETSPAWPSTPPPPAC
ncbi:MAG: hypothetical protein ACK56I_35460, partial [bacterium]